MKKYEVITICGSTKFKDQHLAVQERLTMEGHIVLACGVYGHADGIQISNEEKKMLDEVCMAKIRMSDSIFVVNPMGYIGESTTNEINYAKELGKDIYFLCKPENEVFRRMGKVGWIN